jgi:hypothetical protein
VSRGIPEAFEEYERDTAKRETPPELLEIKRTTKMAKVDLNALRTAASGARRAVSDADIQQYTRERDERDEAIESDPHSRPTLENVSAADRAPPPESGPLPVTSTETPISPIVPRPRPQTIPAWVVAFMVMGMLAIVAAAGTVGFALGRASR